MSKEIRRFPRLPDVSIFHTPQEIASAPPITFSISKFLQNDAATLIAGPSGEGKTWMMLSIVKALLAGPDTKLWGHFKVREQAIKVIYLTPENALTPIVGRLKSLGIYHHTQDGTLLLNTLSKGPAPSLKDQRLLDDVRGAHVFLDTIVRFGTGDENSAGDVQVFADKVLGLIGAGARAVIGAHHSPKTVGMTSAMTQENFVRGSGNILATFATIWGVKQIDTDLNILHIENLKSRDFLPCGPFEIVGRPHIDMSRDFRMHKKPGSCGTLAKESGSRRTWKRSKRMNQGVERVAQLTKEHGEEITDKYIVKQFKKNGWGTLAESTARKYRKLALNGKRA